MRGLSRIGLALLLVGACSVASARAQEETPLDPEERTAQRTSLQGRLAGELGLRFLRFQNFFQAPDGEPETNVNGLQLRAELAYRLSMDRPLEAYVEAGRVAYQDLEDSSRVGAGLRLDGRPHAFDLSLALETDRPILDVGDEFETADVIYVDGEYGYRLTSDWELKGLLEAQDQSFEFTSRKDNTIHGLGAAVRYRGFGYEFSPEVGLLLGGRDATDVSENHSQNDVYVKIRSVPAPGWYISARYRHRVREYDTDVVTDRNFGREDTRDQLSAVIAYELTEELDVDAYLAHQDAESTLASRTFTTQILFLGLSWGF